MLYPDQPLVLNYLGYSWVDRGVHLDEAFQMLRKAVALRPGGRLHRRQPGLGALPPRRLCRGRQGTRACHRAEARRPDHQRPSRRRLLARRPEARCPVPVEPCPRLEAPNRKTCRPSWRRSSTGLPDPEADHFGPSRSRAEGTGARNRSVGASGHTHRSRTARITAGRDASSCSRRQAGR